LQKEYPNDLTANRLIQRPRFTTAAQPNIPGDIGFPQLPTTPPQASGEFQADWRAASTTDFTHSMGTTWPGLNRLFERLDLNRSLPDYPAPDPATGLITNDADFYAAQTARQQFAADIFNRIRAITGTAPPFGSMPGPEKDVLRWYAQLA